MGNGFRRLMDLSPLGIKNLNDQLEQIWLKVMGGIGFRDLDSNTRKIIQEKATKDDVKSIIEQSADQILLSVAKAGGDNLIKNGDWQFDTQSWETNNCNIVDEFAKINTGYVYQTGIKVEGEKEYTVGFSGSGNGNGVCEVYGQYQGQSLDAMSVKIGEVAMEPSPQSKDFRLNITIPQGVVTCLVKIKTVGEYNIRMIYFRKGNNVGEYISNPNEMTGSGIRISDGAVDISTPRFNLDIVDKNGKTISALNADGNGFDTVQCKNLFVGGRGVLNATKTVYVNSETGCDANDGLTVYTPFKTIAKAMKEMPFIIVGAYNIYLCGGTYYENVVFNYGGFGVVNFFGEGATINGRVVCSAGSYNLFFSECYIYTTGEYCLACTGADFFVELNGCVFDGNKNPGVTGLFVKTGARIYMKECEINNCIIGIYCFKGAKVDMMDCVGKNNTYGIRAGEMGVVNILGTVPMAEVYIQELTGGVIEGVYVGGSMGDNYVIPRTVLKSAFFKSVLNFSLVDGEVIDGVMKQGKGKGAFCVFDTAAIKSALQNKNIKTVKATVTRRDDDAFTHTGVLRVFCHNKTSLDGMTGQVEYVGEYGNLANIKRGETVTFELPLEFITLLRNGRVAGLLFYYDGDAPEYELELNSGEKVSLEVVYE